MQDRCWLVGHLPARHFRLGRFVEATPGTELHVLHAGRHRRDPGTHDFLVSLVGDEGAWRSLRGVVRGDLRGSWTPLSSGRDAIVRLTETSALRDETRRLLRMTHLSRISCLRFAGARASLYALPPHESAVPAIQNVLESSFGAVPTELRSLAGDERAWCSRMLTIPEAQAVLERP